MPELRKKLAAQLESTPSEPFVEVRVGQRLMAITFECGSLTAADVELVVTRATARIRCKSDPSRLNLTIALPMTAEPGRYWARFNHGVCDVLMARREL